MLEKSAAKFGYWTLVVTDDKTDIDSPWLRVGNADAEGLMMWILKAQAAAMAASQEPGIMVSPDTLISKPLDFMVGGWDLSLLTRIKPKPIVNSVIGFCPTPAAIGLWNQVVTMAASLSAESKEWGADIDAVVNRLSIRPHEKGKRIVDGATIKFMQVDGKFQSVKIGRQAQMLSAPIWDFKGPRKYLMKDYARLLNAHI